MTRLDCCDGHSTLCGLADERRDTCCDQCPEWTETPPAPRSFRDLAAAGITPYAPATGRLCVLVVDPEGITFTIGPVFSEAAARKVAGQVKTRTGWTVLGLVGIKSAADSRAEQAAEPIRLGNHPAPTGGDR